MSLTDDAHHALNRFGLGSRPGEAHSIRDPSVWLLAQVNAKAASEFTYFSALPSSLDYMQREYDYFVERSKAKKAALPMVAIESTSKSNQNPKKMCGCH